ncbi:MAG TPA: undecaprenyldiphospho-muramoylpentapeptide beta-N-acetylglucosaminyltransferase, partial [Gammaproteobacteria bacterium]|nr:undecaprenyldiphospho-muramoylpentapeptide beta-N-acetylglucosaminyltransferase [Gammaproteobacteria bacterium]
MTFVIMAGGTGGHVFPALSVAEVLRGRGHTVTWIGTRQGLEARLVPEAGLDIEWIEIGGVRGKGIATRLKAPFALARGVLQAWRILRRLRPGAVLGMGGFASGPGGLAARLAGFPLLLHEQNTVPGLTNRVLSRLAQRVMEGFPGSFPASRRAEYVGNPVRADIAALPAPAERFAGRNGAPRVLVLGGSQGARILNECLPLALARLGDTLKPEVWHQCGAADVDRVTAAYREQGVSARVTTFISDMAQAYAWADLAVCRA